MKINYRIVSIVITGDAQEHAEELHEALCDGFEIIRADVVHNSIVYILKKYV